MAAAQIRVTWCWVAVPLLWVAFRPSGWKAWFGVGAAAGILVAALYGEAIWLYAPFPNFMHDVLVRAASSPTSAAVLVVRHTLKSVGHYLAPTRDNLVQVGLRYQTLLIGGAALYHVLARRQRQRKMHSVDNAAPTSTQAAMPTNDASTADLAFGFVFLNLLCIVGFVTAFYDVFDWRDYRVVAPHLLLSLLVLAGVGARQWFAGYAAVAVLVGLLVPAQFARFHERRVTIDRDEIAAFSREIGDIVTRQDGVTGWDNTVLMDIDRLGSPLVMGLPPGIGAAPIYEHDVGNFPARSKYVLLTPQDAVRFSAPSSLHKIATTRLGDLYVQEAARSATTARSDPSHRVR